MTDEELQVRQLLKDDFRHYASRCLKIRTKAGEVTPFVLNKAQLFIDEQLEKQRLRSGRVRALILKGRQQGCSTYVGGRFYHKTTHNTGIQCFILTHALDATNNLFKMAQRFYENTPDLVQPSVSTNNSKELIFGGLDSGYKVGTAENKNVGRSATIQYLHCSEVAFWNNAADHATGIMQAVPDAANTEIIMESTANGIGNYFHQMWQKAESGQSDFIAIFVPWFWQEEYKREVPEDFKLNHVEYHLRETYGLTDEQLAWRRYKIIDLSVNGQDGEKSFCQEYPCNANEAFQLTGEDTFIESAIVMKARKGIAEPYGALLLGVDPARFGDDRTSVIFRQGRLTSNLQSYIKKDTMEVTGIVHNLIEKHRPDMVFIDVVGLGAGVVDRLNELYPGNKFIVAVNAGSKPYNADKYYNKRAEMWGECKEYLEQVPVQIPDSDSLHADLCAPRYKFTSNSQLVIESKDDMKKRGVRSPDEAEALILTFALPASAYHQKKTAPPIVKSLANDFNQKLNAIQRARR